MLAKVNLSFRFYHSGNNFFLLKKFSEVSTKFKQEIYINFQRKLSKLKGFTIGRKFPLKLSTDWLSQIATGLEYCHENKTIHHDLKVSYR